MRLIFTRFLAETERLVETAWLAVVDVRQTVYFRAPLTCHQLLKMPVHAPSDGATAIAGIHTHKMDVSDASVCLGHEADQKSYNFTVVFFIFYDDWRAVEMFEEQPREDGPQVLSVPVKWVSE